MSSRCTMKYYPFKGGINTEDPALSVASGELIDANNYEPKTRGGYRRVQGIERFDGHPLASGAVYHIVTFENGEHEPNFGESMQGGTSGAVGVLINVVVESGTWVGGDASGYMVLWIVSGVFVTAEAINHPVPEAFTSGFSAGYN